MTASYQMFIDELYPKALFLATAGGCSAVSVICFEG
jgi:hypothetical protein